MKKTLLVIVAFVAGALIAFVLTTRYWVGETSRQAHSFEAVTLTGAYAPLKALRSGKTDLAIQTLEEQLDMALWQFSGPLVITGHDIDQEVFRMIKEYRMEYPPVTTNQLFRAGIEQTLERIE